MGDTTQPGNRSTRLYFVDWLRVLAVLLLFPFHTLRVYNAGEPFYVKGSELSVAVSYLLGFISVWHMPLLFALAGVSTYFALAKRDGRRYVAERRDRLLLPLGLGIFLIIPPQTWYGARFNSGYTQSFIYYIVSGDFLHWNIQNGGDYYGGFGIGQLWFILYLFVISMVALPLLLWWRSGHSERGARAFARVAGWLHGPGGWLIAAFALFVGDALPDPIGKHFFYYLAVFVLGFVAIADKRFVETSARWRWPAMAAGLALSALWVGTWQIRDALPDPGLGRAGFALMGGLATWLVIVGAFGFGSRLLDKPSPALSYLAPASYPIYILHQTVIVVLAFYVVQAGVPAPVQWAMLLVAAVALTFAAYEALRRIPWARLVIGVKVRRQTPPSTPVEA